MIHRLEQTNNKDVDLAWESWLQYYDDAVEAYVYLELLYENQIYHPVFTLKWDVWKEKKEASLDKS